jgi:hypothetical protein
MRLSHEPCVGVKVNWKRPTGCLSEPGIGLFGDVRGMIVEDQLDRCVSWIGGIEKLEKFDEFAAAMTVPDERVNLTGEQVNTGQQTDSATAFIFVIAVEGRVHAGLAYTSWQKTEFSRIASM